MATFNLCISHSEENILTKLKKIFWNNFAPFVKLWVLYIRFKSLVNDFVYSFGRAALLLLVEV